MYQIPRPELEFLQGFFMTLIVAFVAFGLSYLWLWAFAGMYKMAFYFHFLP